MILLLKHTFLLLSHPFLCYKSSLILFRFRRHFAAANPVGEDVSGVLVTPSGVGVQVVTKLKRNMKQRLMSLSDRLLLRKRAVALDCY